MFDFVVDFDLIIKDYVKNCFGFDLFDLDLSGFD